MSRTHGMPSTYTTGGCRCDDCTQAHMAYKRLRRKIKAARLVADQTLASHGTVSTYQDWGCRCDECRAANTRRMREYQARRAEWARLRREAAS